MVVLADELLENFFGRDLPASFQLEPAGEEDYHQAHQKPEGLLGGFMSLVVTNESVGRSLCSTAIGAHYSGIKIVSIVLRMALVLPSANMQSGGNRQSQSHLCRNNRPSWGRASPCSRLGSRGVGLNPQSRKPRCRAGNPRHQPRFEHPKGRPWRTWKRATGRRARWSRRPRKPSCTGPTLPSMPLAIRMEKTRAAKMTRA